MSIITRLGLTRYQNLEKAWHANRSLISLVRSVFQLKGEYLQDCWVVFELEHKHHGYFVDFGATNGVDASNTYLLERSYHWDGIVCEPGQSYYSELAKNRSCSIDNRIVWDQSNVEIEFLELDESYLSGAKIDSIHRDSKTKSYLVPTVTLSDLLDEHKAPKQVDLISIDVEGSEYRILSKFFEDGKYASKLLIVEHNWRSDSWKLRQLLEDNGYEIKFEELSERDYWCKLR